MAITPVIPPPTAALAQRGIREEENCFSADSSARMKKTAASPQNAPRTALRTRSRNPERMYGGTWKIRTFPSSSLETVVEMTEAITMGANVAAAKSPRSTSRLKKTPPMGALKTAAIPPAAPHATKMRMRVAETLRNCPTADPIAAPIWAIGASRPTEPPEPIVTAAVKGPQPHRPGTDDPAVQRDRFHRAGDAVPLGFRREPLEERTDQETPEQREEKHQVRVTPHRLEDPAEKELLEEPDEQDERHRAEAGQSIR